MPIKNQFETLYHFDHLCPVCGNILSLHYSSPICNELAKDWNLTDQQRRFLDFREGCACTDCGSSIRRMNLTKVLLETINARYRENIQFLRDVANMQGIDRIKIAEINNCGNLHQYLTAFPALSYSEYGSEKPGVPSEDLMALRYQDNQFDIVLTSDVLEHVPDYHRALSEIRRVLKDDGVFIFTVPWLNDRKTVTRARIAGNGSVEHLKPPSYHGEYALNMADHLVFYEFGTDFVDDLAQYFATSQYCDDGFGGSISSVFMCRKR